MRRRLARQVCARSPQCRPDVAPSVHCVRGNATLVWYSGSLKSCARLTSGRAEPQAVPPGRRAVPTRILVLVPVPPRQLMGTANSPLESQSGQDRSGNIQVQGQFGMLSTTLFNLFIRAAPALPCGSPFRAGVPAGTSHHAHGSSVSTPWAPSGVGSVPRGSAGPPALPARRNPGSGCASPAAAPCSDSQPHSHTTTCPCLCRYPQTVLLSV